MGLFGKKEKITIDQYSYLFISKIMEMNDSNKLENISLDDYNIISSLTVNGTLMLGTACIMKSLGKSKTIDEELGFIVGKSFTDAYIYWMQKNNIPKQTIESKLDELYSVENDASPTIDNAENGQEIDELIYMYINKRITKELDLNKRELSETSHMISSIAAYVKHALKNVSIINDNIIKNYTIEI